ncbi:cytosolic factor, phosphatidylinositol/phosphatidylcholine transfer protein [Gonapodya sp. JEL0774]|nr:cytosolic factor, phosphatidylinositol/phosphatidylcholine transfer protein [Gonapodya sp. JEL0774]
MYIKTPEQQAALNEFKDSLKADNLYDSDFMDDHTLLRFLRARRFDVAKTKLMFVHFLNWRKEFKVEEIYKTFVYTEKAEVAAFYPRYYHKQDKDGRPLWIEHLGRLSTKEVFKATTEERFMQNHVLEFEKFLRQRLPACSYRAGKHIEQSCTILDLKGVSLSHFPQATAIVKKISAISQDYYPETLGKMYIVNAPVLFSGCWSVIKHFLDENTVAKIHIYSSNYKEALLSHIPAENLPVELGGTCNCQGGCRTSDAGPWKEINEEDWEKAKEFHRRDTATQLKTN